MVEPGQHGRRWVRFTPRQRFTRFLIFAGILAAIAWSIKGVEFNWPWLFDAPQQMGDLLGRMVPPDFTNLGTILRVLVETVNIATIATGAGVILSLPVALSPRRTPLERRDTLAGPRDPGNEPFGQHHHLGAAVRRHLRAGRAGRHSCHHFPLHRLSRQDDGRGHRGIDHRPVERSKRPARHGRRWCFTRSCHRSCRLSGR